MAPDTQPSFGMFDRWSTNKLLFNGDEPRGRHKQTEVSRTLDSGVPSRQTFISNPLGNMPPPAWPSSRPKPSRRTYGMETGRSRSRSPNRGPTSFRRDRDYRDQVMRTVNSTNGTLLQTGRFLDTYNANALARSANRLRQPIGTAHDREGDGYDLTSTINHIQQFVLSLQGRPLSLEDLYVYLIETLRPNAKQLVAENWNVIASVVYAPAYRQLCTEESLEVHFAQNKGKVMAGRDSNPTNLVAGIPHIHFTTKVAPTKQGHLHVARGVWLLLRLPVNWEGSVVDEDLGIFSNAVGIVSAVGPTELLQMHTRSKQRRADELASAGYSPEKPKARDEKRARQELDRVRQLQEAEEAQKRNTHAAMTMVLG